MSDDNLIAAFDDFMARSLKDFFMGLLDCQNGHTARQNASEAYLEGYGIQYANEQKQQGVTNDNKRIY